MKKVFYFILSFFSKLSFWKNSLYGVNFVSGPFSKCTNLTRSRKNLIIGNNCEIQGSIILEKTGRIVIGDYTTIRYNSRLFSIDKIIIGDYVIISNNVTIYDNNNHPTSPNIRKKMSISGFYSSLWNATHSISSPIIIEDNVWIGERSYILKGVKIGKGSIVGLNSVVTKDVPAYCVVVGNPAKIVKRLDP